MVCVWNVSLEYTSVLEVETSLPVTQENDEFLSTLAIGETNIA